MNVAANGTVIEQAQIVTTHNLAAAIWIYRINWGPVWPI